MMVTLELNNIVSLSAGLHHHTALMAQRHPGMFHNNRQGAGQHIRRS